MNPFIEMASLVSEVLPHVLINHTIKSAEQVFYRQKSVYSTANLDQASTSSAGENSSTKKSESESDEVAALRKQVSQLTFEKQQLAKEIADLRVQLQKPSRLTAFTDLGSHILILGDGNLSFTLALARRFPAKRIVGSVLEAQEEFFLRFCSGADTLKTIGLECHNVVILFGVDATKLRQELFESSVFSDIIMNFPHHCGKTNLRRSRQLLRGVFESAAAELMIINSTRLHITLARGQSGLCEEQVQDGLVRLPIDYGLPQHRSDSWQAVYLAVECGLRLAEVRLFDPTDFPGYICTGYLNREQRFHNENAAITLSFVKAVDPAASIHLGEARRIESSGNWPARRSDVRNFHAFRPYFLRDLSILYDASLVDRPTTVDEAERKAMVQIRLLAGPLVVQLTEVGEMRTVFNGRPNRIYRLYWQGDHLPLHKKLVNRLHDELCRAMEGGGAASWPDNDIPSGFTSHPAAAAPPAAADGDKAVEDFDLFGSDDEEESEEQKRIREERLSAYAAKKAKKPGPIAKSSVIIDVKPWDDETDLKKMEECVRSIIKDGLLWGASKLIPVGYGIQKLQIVSTIEDEKISVDNDLVEFIQEEFADYVQSVDIVAFNKI